MVSSGRWKRKSAGNVPLNPFIKLMRTPQVNPVKVTKKTPRASLTFSWELEPSMKQNPVPWAVKSALLRKPPCVCMCSDVFLNCLKFARFSSWMQEPSFPSCNFFSQSGCPTLESQNSLSQIPKFLPLPSPLWAQHQVQTPILLPKETFESFLSTSSLLPHLQDLLKRPAKYLQTLALGRPLQRPLVFFANFLFGGGLDLGNAQGLL